MEVEVFRASPAGICCCGGVTHGSIPGLSVYHGHRLPLAADERTGAHAQNGGAADDMAAQRFPPPSCLSALYHGQNKAQGIARANLLFRVIMRLRFRFQLPPVSGYEHRFPGCASPSLRPGL